MLHVSMMKSGPILLIELDKIFATPYHTQTGGYYCYAYLSGTAGMKFFHMCFVIVINRFRAQTV